MDEIGKGLLEAGIEIHDGAVALGDEAEFGAEARRRGEQGILEFSDQHEVAHARGEIDAEPGQPADDARQRENEDVTLPQGVGIQRGNVDDGEGDGKNEQELKI